MLCKFQGWQSQDLLQELFASVLLQVKSKFVNLPKKFLTARSGNVNKVVIDPSFLVLHG